MKKDKYLPYKEKMRRYDYQFDQIDIDDKIMRKKEEKKLKKLKKLKRQAMKGEINI